LSFSLHIDLLRYPHHLVRLSFPTRRSSDLWRSAAIPGGRKARVDDGSHQSETRNARLHAGLFGRQLDARTRGSQASRCRRDLLRSEEHTSELQSPDHLVCRLLLERKKQEYT